MNVFKTGQAYWTSRGAWRVKSELSGKLATLFSAKFIDIECHSLLESSDLGASWNAFKQIVDAQSGQLEREPFSVS